MKERDCYNCTYCQLCYGNDIQHWKEVALECGDYKEKIEVNKDESKGIK